MSPRSLLFARGALSRVLAALPLGALVVASPALAHAQDEAPSGRDLVVWANTGFQWGIAPGIFVPTSGGDAGFSLAGMVGYGVEAGPVILVPAASVHAFFPRSGTIVLTYAQGEVILPIGAFAPYLLGGAGPGFLTGDAGSGAYAGLMGGGGAMYHFSPRFALGVEATYQTLLSTSFSVIGIGPRFLLAF